MTREAFEAQIRTQFPTATDELLIARRVIDGRYGSMVTEHAWLAWQAATNAALEQAAEEVNHVDEAIFSATQKDFAQECTMRIRALKEES